MAIGGDSLEENFVIDDGQSSSIDESENECIDTEKRELSKENISNDSSGGESQDEPESKAKKMKLNMREAATSSDGTVTSQRSMLRTALNAFEKYFPNQECPLAAEGIDKFQLLDCSSHMSQSNKSVQDMLHFVNDETECLNIPTTLYLRTLILTGSGTRAMYMVKELREMNKDLSPLPLFYHGGGRKKEQSKTHESVLTNSKSLVAVSLPSRLIDATKKGLANLTKLELVIIDLKANEKGLNVLSQKDTMMDVLKFLGEYILPNSHSIKLAML